MKSADPKLGLPKKWVPAASRNTSFGMSDSVSASPKSEIASQALTIGPEKRKEIKNKRWPTVRISDSESQVKDEKCAQTAA